MAGFYPESYTTITSWAAATKTPVHVARRRFIQFCVLESVTADPRLQKIMLLRGSAALQLFYGGKRDCEDLDLIALNLDGTPIIGSDPQTPRTMLNRLLAERLPMHFCGERAWDEWLKTIKIDISPARSTYDVRRVILSDSPFSPGYNKWINVVTLEVLVAQKIYGIAEAIARNSVKRREKDVFDLASLRLQDRKMNWARVGELLRKRADRERFQFDIDRFERGVTFVGAHYDTLAESLGEHFISFNAAWNDVRAICRQVGWP